MVWHLELGVENKGDPYLQDVGMGVGMVKLVRLQHLGVKSSVGRSLSRSAVRREFVRIGDEGGGPSGHQMDRIHGGNISPARQFMRLRSGSVGSDTVRLGVRLGLPKRVYETGLP